jgi:8-oxo-dGTP diphosphatase
MIDIYMTDRLDDKKPVTGYVAGFMFHKNENVVALIKKNRPAWQAGKYNAIGGHIEPGEVPIEAMIREFKEETDINTTPGDWTPVCVLEGEGFVVHFYASQKGFTGGRSVTDELVYAIELTEINENNAIPNLMWLIPAAQLALKGKSPLLHVKEAA